MPLLDPNQQFFFCNIANNSKKNRIKTPNKSKGVSRASFFLKYLPIASKYLQESFIAIKTHYVFQEDFLNNIDILNKEFKMKIPPKENLVKKKVHDYFNYFYDQFEEKNEVMEGKYYKLLEINKKLDMKSKMKFFEAEFGCKTHRWHFLNYSAAILSIYNMTTQKFNETEIVLLKLEVDLLHSLGFVIILCLYLNNKSDPQITRDLIKTGLFSEIHMNVDRSLTEPQTLDKFINIIQDIYKGYSTENNNIQTTYWNFNTYFYLYISYSDKISESGKKLKELKKNPYFQRFYYSKPLNDCFAKLEKLEEKEGKKNCFQLYFEQSKNDFAYCDVGYDCPFVEVQLCKIPLYKDKSDASPCQFTQLDRCYIKNEDFLIWKGTRVKGIFADDRIMYIDFDDIHIMKPEFYVSDTIYYLKANENLVDGINNIIEKSEKNDIDDKFKNEKFSTLFRSVQTIVEDKLSFLTYAFKKLRNIGVWKYQLFTALNASTSCLFAEDNQQEKGIIYQIDTGEGKSIVIQMIAALLASTGKMVHIATSNIHLANRDYSESYEFFEELGLDSSVLLHKNEIPKLDSKEKQEIDIKHFETESFSDENFENSLEMNFNVCGIGNHGEKKVSTEKKIVFSTFINFEALYLKMSENWSPKNIGDYFNKHMLIVDEADTILIDELANGTILSHTLPSNASEVLTFIYGCKTGRLSKDNISKITEHFYPNFPYIEGLQNSYIKLIEERQKEIEENAKKKEENSNEKEENIKKMQFIYETTLGQLSKECMVSIFEKLTDSEKRNFEYISNEIKNLYEHKFDKEKIPIPLDEEKAKNLFLFICQILDDKPDRQIIIEIVKENWPQSVDLKKFQIDQMFKEIELVHTPEFQNGIRYVIQPIKGAKKKKKKHNKIKKLTNIVSQVINFNEFFEKQIERKANQKNESLNEELADQLLEKNEQLMKDKEEKKSVKEEEKEKRQSTEKKHKKEEKKRKKKEEKRKKEEEEEEEEEIFEVIPYDYDNKGIVERNKEFSGFIQQFIAIKEKINEPIKYKHLKINGLTFNYLYVSHPIFTNLYKKVCGFTGTIGNKYDKNIFKEHYKLSTYRIPRNLPNRRINLPIILCKDDEERNDQIRQEVMSFHEQRNPVLIVLRDINEVAKLKALLETYFANDINVFNGTNVSISPEEIAGIEGSISIGTNFCGRGTDIKVESRPLHVIVAYYSSNVRSIQQAFGRTARKGSEGTCRIICSIDDYVRPIIHLEEESIDKVVGNFDYKKNKQSKFIKYYQKHFNWIFSHEFDNKLAISKAESQTLKETRINVNRIVACNYKFPIGMSICTFLSIQAQKIFSLYNCPNCKYTWMLFQRYIREFLLQSWSMMIDKVDTEYFNDENLQKKKKI